MCNSFHCLRLIICLVFIATINVAQPIMTLPVEAKRQGEEIVFIAQPTLNGFRVALYDLKGNLRAESEALTPPTLRWAVPTKLQPGEYLCVLWLRGQAEAEKVLARLEVRATTITLQEADAYLQEVELSDFAFTSSPKYTAAEQRAHKRGVAAIPFFRIATKVLPDETNAHLLLAQAIQTKYPRGYFSLAPPPPPPPPPPPALSSSRKGGSASRRKKAEPIIEISAPEPTPAEKQEMLAACQKAVAVAKTCPEKTNAMQWLAAIQGNFDQREAQLTTLEQITQASCATKEIKAQSWYVIGVNEWQCSYDLTTRYADPKRLMSDPFHYRNITNAADQQRAASCVEKAMAAIDQAITLSPDDGNAWAYRSLLYRERQKTSASEAERQKFSAMAEEAARRAVELIQKQQNIK